MKKIIKVTLVFILIILNIIAGGFYIFLLFTINTPDIYVEVDITELTSGKIQLETLVDISNAITFDLTLKNIKIVSET